MKLDPMQRARDFTTGRHPRRDRKSTQRHLAELDSRVTTAFDAFGGGGGGGNLILDDLPEADASYVGKAVTIMSPAGQPAGVYTGGQDAFDNPVWVAQTAGDPYSLTHKRVVVPDAGFTGYVGGIAASPTSLYVSSPSGSSVLRYTHEGDLVATYNPALLANSPEGLAYDGVNDRVAVCGYDGAGVMRGFQVWTADFSSRIFEQATFGTGSGQFGSSTAGVVADTAGAWYVADPNNNRVQKFDAAGAFVLAFAGGGSLSSFATVADLTIDSDGNIHVVDQSSAKPQVQKFDASGTFLLEYGPPGHGPGQLEYPVAITCTDDNYLLIIDYIPRKVVVFTTDGTYVSEIPLDKVLPATSLRPKAIADYRGSVFISSNNVSTSYTDVRLFRAGNATTSSLVVASSSAVVSQAARILDFSSKFLVTESPEGEANIDIDYGTVAVGLNGSLVSADISTFDFSPAFTVTESPSGEANIGLAAFTPASSSGPASLALAEDTDNGTNKVTIIAPASIASDKTATLQDVTGTLALMGNLGLIYLNSGTFSASTGFNQDGDLTTTYRKYLLVVTIDDATSAGGLGFLLRDTTPANISTGYERAMLSMVSSSNTVTGNSVTNAAELSLMTLINGAVDGTVWIEIVSPRQTDKTHGKFQASSLSTATTTYQMLHGSWGQRATTAAAGFRIVPSAGNITGRWALYGYPD